MVKDFLDWQTDVVGGYTYYDTSLPCSPNQRRPDFVWVLQDRLVILEVDEHSHRHYNFECEVARITELMEQAGALPIFLVRFNPQEKYLPNLVKLLQDCFNAPITNLLHAVFLGYKAEYDVVAEIERIASQRISFLSK
jgi:hypothetical protein